MHLIVQWNGLLIQRIVWTIDELESSILCWTIFCRAGELDYANKLDLIAQVPATLEVVFYQMHCNIDLITGKSVLWKLQESKYILTHTCLSPLNEMCVWIIICAIKICMDWLSTTCIWTGPKLREKTQDYDLVYTLLASSTWLHMAACFILDACWKGWWMGFGLGMLDVMMLLRGRVECCDIY